MVSTQVIYIIILSTVVFLIAPAALIFYVNLYNNRKKKHIEEKKLMKQLFDTELVKSRMEVREQTLQTLAHELHDNIGQILSLAAITLSFADPYQPEDCTNKIANTEELVKRSVTELRRLSHVLYGEQLLSQGLAKAIQNELGWMEKTGSYTIRFQQHGAISRSFEPEHEIVTFRLFQELVSNILKHADANMIEVTIDAQDEDLNITITDNGKGFKPDSLVSTGLGLETVRKRAMLMGGKVHIDSEPGRGTKYIISIPHIKDHEFTS